MDNYYVIANTLKDPDLLMTRKVVNYFREHGKNCGVIQKGPDAEKGDYHYTDEKMIPQDVECVLVLGGDGTLLQAARDLVHRQIPLLGINLGTLGYLAQIDRYAIYPVLDQLIRGEYALENRMMLRGRVYHEGVMIKEDMALNDIVISKGDEPHVVKYLNYVNDSFLYSYNADGIIISTPTGSTGYSLSAGGPIISPSASMIMMTPLAPHTLNSRSIVFADSDRITVEIGPGRMEALEHARASFDGDTVVALVTGDRIEICKYEKGTKLVKINNVSFLETLRKKMN